MADHIARTDGPAAQDSRLAERTPRGHANLQGRLERLAPGHPSSAGPSAEHLPRSAERVTASRPEGTDASRVREPGRRAPDNHGQPDRSAVGDFHLDADRARHVLAGDGPGKPGGGHRHGTGIPGKTEFPRDWPDGKIVSTIEDVARNPDTVHWQVNGRWRVSGEREQVRVWAIVRPGSGVWTAWPEPGGAGVTQNPRA